MKDTLTMTKKRSSLLIGIAILLICVLAFGVAITLAPTNTANAADYSYDPAVNGSSWDDETGLTVCFTCTDNGLTMYNWTLFLFDPSSFSNIDYEDSHKLTDSGSMNQNSASYCFNSEYDESQYTGVITIVWDKETQALGKSDTLESVWAQKDWRVVIGPHHTWQGNESYNCDYYVGEATTIARDSSAVSNFEGKDTLMNGETAEYTGSIYVSNGSSSNPGIIEYNYDQGQNSIQYRNKIEDANNPDNGNFKYSFGGDECFIIPSDGSDDLPRGIKIVDGDGTQENPYVFEGVYPAGLEFTTAVAGETVRYVDNANIGDTVVVTYKVTHNTGVNSLLLIPEFDSTVFAIDQISVNEETSLGEATITSGDGTKKILLENTGAKYNALDGEEEFFLTVVYKIIAPVGGEYEFGLDLTSEGENNKSVAYYIEDGAQKGEQTEVEIGVIKANALTLIVKQAATIEIGANNSEEADDQEIVWDYFFGYTKQAVGVQKVDELTDIANADGYYVEFTYNGDAIPQVTWYEPNYVYDEGTGEWSVGPGNVINTAIMYAGDYVIGIKAPATDRYYAVEEQYAYVHIHPLLVTVTIADKESDFGDAIVELTYTADREPFEGDSFTINLSTTATSASPIGTYPITGAVSNVVGSYTFSFTEGTYTINGKAITLTALDQTAAYTGSEPTVDQTKYTITDTASGAAYALDADVIITKVEGVNVGTYTLTPSFASEPAGYIVTYTNGNFSITSVGEDVEAIKAYFEGLSKVYSGSEQDLLQVNGLPAYYYYEATNNMQTNVNDYVIGITVNADANHNIGGEQSCYFTVNGAITPKAVTITAGDVNVVYGETPVVPQFSVEGTSEEIAYTYAVKDNGEAFTPAADTAVGAYDIVLTAGNNPNFNVTCVDGVYTVSKANAQVTASANDVYYNRALSVTTSASVNTLSLTPVVTYYSDSACTQEVTPVDTGVYYAKAVVAGTGNYNGAEATASFEILQVMLSGVEFTYEHGNVVWTAVTSDIGKTATETGVAPKALKEGTTVTYKVYKGTEIIGTYDGRSFDAVAATTYKVVAEADDDNYLNSVTFMAPSHEVSFAEGEHLGNPNGEVTGMPNTQYIFDGQSAIAPDADPEVPSCTFIGWKLGDAAYAFTEAVGGDIVLVADWDAITYTVTLKYLPTSATEGTDMFTISVLYLNSTVSYAGLGVAPVKSSDNAGIYYTFAGKWMDENSVEYAAENDGIANFTVQGDMTFVAVFDANYNAFRVFYYLANGVSTDANAYQQVGEAQIVTYGDTIEYRPLEESQVAWFKINGWYSNTDRTGALLATMPNEDISVYAGYVFDIGTGDVNADGRINANDITIYRQWIVGGYDVIEVQKGDEWATATGDEFDADNRYFLMSVADDNLDLSRDIRDVSITRMAIVRGYSWDIVTDSGVTGEAIVRSAPSYTINAIVSGLNTFGRARLYQTVTAATESIELEGTKNYFIDLGGYTLTVKSLSLITSGKDATITVMNGTIIAEDGITLAAPNGNVVIEDVTAYVDGNPINLQAANSSLHFVGNVKLYEAEIIDGEINEFAEAPAPAVIHVEEGTHVVVEAQAEVVLEKIIVTQNTFQVPTEPTAEATITLDNKTETEIVVQGNTLNEISDLTGLIAAAKAGGTYVVTGDIAYNGCLSFQADATIDLNGHTIRSANNIALGVSDGATLTINGEGNVIAQEACVMAFDGSEIVINGGTYTSYDNFVIGTNGTAGRGANKITVNGGVFNGGIQSAGYVACGIYVANSDTVVVNGGTFNVTNGCGILARSGNTTVNAGATFNVTGDGTTGKVGDSKVTVPAGAVLVYDLAANYPGGDPVLVNGTDYDVVAVVGSVDDINAVKGFAKEIVLGANITTNYDAPIYFTEDMVLNLNGKTIASTNDVAIRAMNGAKLTINGNGNVNAQEGCVMAFSGSEIVINGGTYTCYDNFVIGTNGTVKPGNDMGHNTITINGGTFNGGIQSAGYVACGIYVANSDTVVVNGGTFNVTNGCGILARSGNTTVGADVVFNVTGDGTKGKVGDSRVVVPAGANIVLDNAANYPGGAPIVVNNSSYEVISFVAKVGNLGYLTFDEAIAAVNASANGGTVILLSDIDFSTEAYAGYKWAGSNYNPLTITNDNVTIDLNGHTISNMGNTAICAGHILAADGRIANFTIKNGTLLAGQTNGVTNSYVLGIAGVENALIKNVTTIGGINVYTGSTNVVIEDCTVQGTKYYAVCAQSGSDVTIKNSVIGKNTDSSVATKIMFWTQAADKDSDMVTGENPTGAFGASSITLESGTYTMNANGVFYSGVKPVVIGGTFNFDPSACVDTQSYDVIENAGVWTVSEK